LGTNQSLVFKSTFQLMI